MRSQNPAICQGEFKELKSRCVLVFHISIKHVYKMPGSPKCLTNQGSLKSSSPSDWEWGPSLWGPHKRYVWTCGHSIDMGSSPFRPLRCSREPEHPSWSAVPAWSRALVLHRLMRCRCCKVRGWLRVFSVPHLGPERVWQTCSHVFSTT